MIDWELWHSASELADTGSYIAAAKRMGVNPTTIKRRKEALELALGRSLFVRQQRRMIPTPAFITALNEVELAAHHLDLASIRMSPELVHVAWRRIVITSVPYICDKLLSPAASRLPAIRRLRIELVGRDSNLELTGSREADIALRLGPTHSKGVAAWHIADIKYSTFILRKAANMKLPWITIDRSHSHLKEGRLPEEHSGEEGIRFTATSTTSIKNVIDSGAAKGLLPEFVGAQNPELKILKDHPSLTRPLWIMWRDDAFDYPHFQTVVKWILHETDNLLSATEDVSELMKKFSI